MRKKIRKMLSVLCIMLVILSMMPTANAADPIERLVISQAATAAEANGSSVLSRSIELYNPTNAAIVLQGYAVVELDSVYAGAESCTDSLNDNTVILLLPDIVIPAKSSYQFFWPAEETLPSALAIKAVY